MDGRKTNAVIYARYSSSGQNEKSITGQLRECYKYAEQKGYNVIGEYYDEAKTGTESEHRYQFQKMIKDASKCQFEAVLVWKFDRFARNYHESGMYKFKLKQSGVKVISITEALPDGNEAVIVEALLDSIAQCFSMNLSSNVKRGNYDAAIKCETVGVKVYGYKKGADNRFEIDSKTSGIVQRIFTEFANGKQAKQIMRELNAEKIPSSNNGEWKYQTMLSMLRNEKYIGIYKHGEVVIEDGMPAIISKELFQKCQDILAKHRRSPAAKRDTNFMLTGKLFCGKCGRQMTGESARSHTKKIYYYYSCAGNRNGVKKCNKKRIGKDVIENAVLQCLYDVVHNEETINKLIDYVMEIVDKMQSDDTNIRILEDRLKTVETEINNLMNAIIAGVITPTVTSTLKEKEALKEELETALQKEYLKQSNKIIDRSFVEYYMSQLVSGEIESEAYQQKLIDTLVKTIYLYDDETIVVDLNMPGTNKKKLSIKDSSYLKCSGTPYQIYTNLFVYDNRMLVMIRA